MSSFSIFIARPAIRAHTSTIAELRAAGVLRFTLAAQFITVIMLAASMAPGYDVSGGAISDLGVIEETSLVFNVSLVLVGVLNVAGGWLFAMAHGRAVVLALFVVGGVGAIGAGLFPLDSGGPHGLFALVAFLAFNLQALAVASVVTGPMRVLSLLAGVVGLVFVGMMVLGDGGNAGAFRPIGHGGTERMIVYPAMLWLLALGGSLMAARDDGASIVRSPR
ncbi:MAG TPA: DUF998 domain-containing protein [Candidatus Limnocylindrales bacterium]|jgi:hypothetical membrane protein